MAKSTSYNPRKTHEVPYLSIVVPAFKCSPCLEELYQRIAHSLDPESFTWELLLIDDRSPDDGFAVALKLAQTDSRVHCLRLSRNFGQHAAITAGISRSRGEWTIVMDCDLQDDPADIPRLIARVREGYDIVLTKRVTRHKARYRSLLSKLYFKFLSRLTGFPVSADYGSFSIISRKVRNAFLQLHENDRHYIMVLLWLGFNRATIDVEHQPRFSGSSSYSFSRLIDHGIEGIFFMTIRPLKWILGLGFCVALMGLLLAIYVTIAAITTHPPSGWASLTVLITIMSGIILICAGVSGMYVGKVFSQTQQRPLYIFDDIDDHTTVMDPQ